MTNSNDSKSSTPTVGMGCTVCYATDRHAATVIAVSKSGHRVEVREDKSIRTDDNGMSEVQSYDYEPDPDGAVHVFYRQSDGSFKAHGKRLALGTRRTYHDYSF